MYIYNIVYRPFMCTHYAGDDTIIQYIVYTCSMLIGPIYKI